MKDAPEPRATSVSILGAPCIREENPEVKNFPLIIITRAASSSSKRPRKTWLSNTAGAGQCHIIWPMEKYISTSRTGTEKSSRFFSFGVS